MSDISRTIDEYALRARLVPTLVVVVIPVMGLLCWLPAFSTTQLGFAAALSAVLVAIFSQVGRDAGKLLEPSLYERWGGSPSVQLLRIRSGLLAMETRERYGHKLANINPRLRLPTEFEEAIDPTEADQMYGSVCLFLRDATRNKIAFPLVFAENVNYGFRRNLLAMKPAGIALSLAGVVSSATATAVGMKGDGFEPPPLPSVIAILNAVMLAWWSLRINPAWVRIAAFAYAERLLGSCDAIQGAFLPTKSVNAEA